MAAGPYLRYVALGDSQTEGLWDGDDANGVRGFADRLAARLEEFHPGVRYANLAVRGRRIRDVLADQLPRAVDMRPDLITSCIGMNDVTRPGRSFDDALADIDVLHDRLADTGATILTTTFPDLEQILPVGRFLSARVLRINAVIRAAAARHGFMLVDLYAAPSMGDSDVWSPDRVHGSALGHELFAAAAAEALELPDSNHEWASARATDESSDLRSRTYSQVLWTRNMLVPWLWRHLRGLSSDDGRGPKRPLLEPVAPASRVEAIETD